MDAAPLRILIVDDDADNAQMLRVLLKQEGYVTRIASDGPTALESARAARPDVVLLDLSLPGMDGIELSTELRRIPELRDCRLVAVTGHGKEALPSPSPFDHYLQKPVQPEDLLAYLAGKRDESTSTLTNAVG